MNEPIFLLPSFQERIWGGTKLRSMYQYEIPSEYTGECWAISAHHNGESIVALGQYASKSLGELWQNHPHLFGFHSSDRFPLLIKILDANDDLSVQVHPDDDFAIINEQGEYGKTECWYIIDCEDDAEIIFGHHAQSKEELYGMIENNQWHELLHRVKIKPGDFFYVPSGTIHALGKGTLVLETQQNSDTTYRVYDYDRCDNKGMKRELHLDKAIAVTTIPHLKTIVKPCISEMDGGIITTFVEEQYFHVHKWEVHKSLELKQEQNFLLASVIAGEGTLYTSDNSYRLQKGQHFILPYDFGSFVLEGQLTLIVSHP